MGWHGELRLDYFRDGERTVAHDRHHGPLRVLQRLYPEGPGICHHVLVHPPGGVAGGDVLAMHATLGEGTHALLTTPGATRFYRSEGATALQSLEARLAPGARLEWLPLEAIAYPGCVADNRVRFTLDGDAAILGWDVLALGLPAAGQPFDRGRYAQRLEWPGRWLEAGTLAAEDRRLLDSPLGLAGARVLGTLWFARGAPLETALRESLLEAARELATASPLAATVGATSPHDRLVLLRVLAHRVEPLMALLQAVRGAWRRAAWGLAPQPPRIWRM